MRDESTAHESGFTEITRGAWYAPTRDSVADYLGVETGEWKVTRRVPSANHTARWEVTCRKCGLKKQTTSTWIRNELSPPRSGARRIGPCSTCSGAGVCKVHADFPLRHEAVLDQFDLHVEEFRTVIAVVAFERRMGRSPSRLEIVNAIRLHASTNILVRKGWLRTAGRPMILISTPKAWRELGVKP